MTVFAAPILNELREIKVVNVQFLVGSQKQTWKWHRQRNKKVPGSTGPPPSHDTPSRERGLVLKWRETVPDLVPTVSPRVSKTVWDLSDPDLKQRKKRALDSCCRIDLSFAPKAKCRNNDGLQMSFFNVKNIKTLETACWDKNKTRGYVIAKLKVRFLKMKDGKNTIETQSAQVYVLSSPAAIICSNGCACIECGQNFLKFTRSWVNH
jgi:hypothetical protein